jgi:hypothetical protein
MGIQDFSTATTNKLKNVIMIQNSESLRKCESVENISSNLLHNGILAELDKINDFISRESYQDSLLDTSQENTVVSTCKSYRKPVSKKDRGKVKPFSTVKYRTKNKPKSNFYGTKIKVSGKNMQTKYGSITTNTTRKEQNSYLDPKRSSSIPPSEKKSSKFLDSSLKRCRILPKTTKKLSLMKMGVTRNTKAQPFSLSKSNYSKIYQSKTGNKNA